MEALARLATRRPVAVTVLAVAIALMGWIAWGRLSLDLLPDIQSPTVVVSVRSGDRPPTEMERLYGEQVEQRLFTVRSIREISQVARTGRLIATVAFNWEADMDLALVDVQKAVGSIASDPDVEEVLVRRFDPRQMPIVSFGLSAPSGQPDLAELRRIARRQVAPALEQLPGVAEVRVQGGREKEVRVMVDRYRMEAHGLTLGVLESRLNAANIDVDAGTLEQGEKVFLVRGLSRFRRPEDIERVVLRTATTNTTGSRRPVRVSDVARVEPADRDIDHLVRVDGKEGVGLSIYKEAGSNTVRVSQSVRKAMTRLSADLPGIAVQLTSDEAALVEGAIADVKTAAGIGIVLAVCVLALFLRSASSTVIVASAVPVSLLAAVFLMRFGGQSLNLMTLAGLALGAGMLVDNAIVVVESIHRRFAAGDSPDDAAARGTAEVAGAIAASTLTTCVVFLPVLFVQGLSARLVEGIAFTVVVSLAASLGVAVMLIPALAKWLLPRQLPSAPAPGELEQGELEQGELEQGELRHGSNEGDLEDRPFKAGSPPARVERWVGGLLRHRFAIVFLAIVLVVGALFSLRQLGTELLPPSDPRQFSLRLVGSPGQRVESTARTVEILESVLRETVGDDLRAIQAEVGRLPEDDRLIVAEQTEENTARIFVRMAADGTRTGRQVVRAVAPAVEDLPGTEISWEVGASALSRAMGSTGPPVVVEIHGRSLEDLRLGAEEIRGRLEERAELWNVRSSFEGGPPELRVVLDRTLADVLGVDLPMVARVLQSSLDGRRVTVLTTGDEERDVVLRLPALRRDQLTSLTFSVDQGTGLAQLTLGQVAKFEPAEGAREIFRRDQRRVAQVTAQIRDSVEYPAALAAAEQALLDAELPPGLHARLAGEEEEREQTVRELAWAGALALLLVFMVLAGTFESLLHPLTVLAAVPLALVGVAVALVPSGRPMGVMAMLGLIVLAGVAVNDAILLVAAARRLIRNGMEREKALARAAAIRLRPIMMTSLTTVLALVPLAVGSGEAAALRGPMAVTIIGGIIASTVASLLILPCLYLLLDRLRLGPQ